MRLIPNTEKVDSNLVSDVKNRSALAEPGFVPWKM